MEMYYGATRPRGSGVPCQLETCQLPATDDRPAYIHCPRCLDSCYDTHILLLHFPYNREGDTIRDRFTFSKRHRGAPPQLMLKTKVQSFYEMNSIISPYPEDKDWITFLGENLAARPPRTQLEIEMRGVVRTGQGRQWLQAVRLANLKRDQKWTSTAALRVMLEEKEAQDAAAVVAPAAAPATPVVVELSPEA
ncbi:hypothetical protein RQP46_007641 [Phenoliferia psychrophenolica]